MTLSDADLLVQVRDVAMRLLARREHSREELRLKLIQRGFEVSSINPVLVELIEQDTLSDARYAQALLSHRSQGGYGPLYIRRELKERGVTPDLIESAFAQADVSWDDVAKGRYQSRFSNQPVDSFKDWARRAAYLQRRGFGKSAIRRVLGDWQGRG